MASPTINAVSALSVGKPSTGFQTKSISYEGANSFQGFLRKSSQPEKTISQKLVTDKEKTTGAENEQLTNEKKMELNPEKNVSGKTTKTETSESTESKTSEKVELSSEEDKKLKDFIEKVQQTLQISIEEMQAWLSTMGMQATDLLDAGKLQNFFMQVKGIDVSTLLTDSRQATELKNLLTMVADLEPLKNAFQTKENIAEFNQKLEEVMLAATDVKSSENKTQSVNIVETPSTLQTENKPDLIVHEEQETGEKQSEISKQQNLPKEAIVAFDKVIHTEEQILVTADGLEKVTTTVSAKDIYQQVVTKFVAENIDGTSKVTVQLNPEHLGKIAFQVVSRQGQVTGQFVAESEAVKTALEAQVSQLKLQLTNQGIRVEDVKVVIGDTANYFTEDRPKEQQQETGKKRAKRIHDGLSMNVVNEETSEEEIIVSTGTIDFTA